MSRRWQIWFSCVNSRCGYLLAAALISCLFGCSSAPDEIVIQGRVTSQGQPLEDGTLSFFPRKGRPVITTLASGGNYECRLSPGDYRVTITVGVTLPAGWKEGDAIPAPDVRLPREYSSRVRSPLQVTVTRGHAEPIDFSLD